mmetsp:Transcript_93270/g.114246  ORF Transcript_93270/g.114246 Transcript_93270/m.114246 type:complete len:205 (-) Transcript_93270:1059-1673(-)
MAKPALNKKKSSKMSMKERAIECEKWIKTISKYNFDITGDIKSTLGDGIALCMAAHNIKPNNFTKKYKSPPKKKKTGAFAVTEARCRIKAFIDFCKNVIKMRQQDLFATEQLQEGTNIKQVILCLENLSSELDKNNMQQPFLIGIQYAKKNKRQFTDEQVRKAKNAIPQLNKGSVYIKKDDGLDSAGIVLHKNVSKTVENKNQE